MDRILQNEEINSENKMINHEFICICPTSSNMIPSQKKKENKSLLPRSNLLGLWK